MSAPNPPDDLLLWEAERQISKSMDPSEFQEAVSTAKLWLMQGNNCEKQIRFIATDCGLKVFSSQVDGGKDDIELDLDVAMVFILRAYRLNRGLTGSGGSALIKV